MEFFLNSKFRHLGKLEKEESETYEEFLQRIQSVMAKKTGLQATDFRLNDKREFIKRLLKENQIKKSSKRSSKKGHHYHHYNLGDFKI